jgi:hypothetical protein
MITKETAYRKLVDKRKNYKFPEGLVTHLKFYWHL